MTQFSKLAAAAALVVVATGAHALGVVDTFSVDQGPVADGTINGLAVWAAQVSDAGILGGHRDMFVDKQNGNASPLREVRAFVDSGVFSYSEPPAVGGRATVRWDGIATGGAVATGGLGGVNLLAMGTGFEVGVLFADHNFPIRFDVWTWNGAMYAQSSSTQVIATGPGNYTFLWGSFAPGANFSQVGAVQMTLANDPVLQALDIDIDFVQIRIPEPGTLALVGAALLGLAAARRRKNAA